MIGTLLTSVNGSFFKLWCVTYAVQCVSRDVRNFRVNMVVADVLAPIRCQGICNHHVNLIQQLGLIYSHSTPGEIIKFKQACANWYLDQRSSMFDGYRTDLEQ